MDLFCLLFGAIGLFAAGMSFYESKSKIAVVVGIVSIVALWFSYAVMVQERYGRSIVRESTYISSKVLTVQGSVLLAEPYIVNERVSQINYSFLMRTEYRLWRITPEAPYKAEAPSYTPDIAFILY